MSFISRSNRFAAAGLAAQARGPLDDQQIAALAPSAFATAPHESRSNRYAYIPTSSVIAGLRAQGFAPVSAKQGRSRIPGKTDFTKHMIRFRHEAQALRSVGQSFPKIVLVNSHDGSSAYHIMAGIFRVVCLNGLIVAERSDGARSVQHKGNVVDNVIDASFEVLTESRSALVAAENWATITLTRTSGWLSERRPAWCGSAMPRAGPTPPFVRTRWCSPAATMTGPPTSGPPSTSRRRTPSAVA